MKKLFFALAAAGILLLAGACEDPTKSSPAGGGSIAVTFSGLTANGSATTTTTKLTLTFDKDITGLAAEDITLDAGTTGAGKGYLTRTGTGVYELVLGSITGSGQVSVSVAKSGYTVSGGPKTVPVYYYLDPDALPVTFSSLTADGSATATTTKLTLTFNKDIAGLTAADIILAPGTTGAQKGELTKLTGTGVYELVLGSITRTGQVSVSVAKSGYTVSGGPKTAPVYYYSDPDALPVTFSSLTANGSATVTTTKLTLTFNKDIAGLTAADITLDAGTTGTQKGELTKLTGTGRYELALTGITAGGNVSVTVIKSGYVISGGPKTAVVYGPGSASLSITFAQITDAAPSITGPVLYRYTNNGPTSVTLTVDNPSQYDSISWRVDGSGAYAASGTGGSFTLSADNAAYNTISTHSVMLSVRKNGVWYSKTVLFTVEL
jgi:hypothetical protein